MHDDPVLSHLLGRSRLRFQGTQCRQSSKGRGKLTEKNLGIPRTIIVALSLLILSSCEPTTKKHPTGGAPEKLTLGTPAVDLSSLIWVAKGRGYFAEQGLDLDIKFYESGNIAATDLMNGKLDLACATEFATARVCIEQPDLRLISILDRTMDQHLVARRDRGISRVSDLRNKRIGVWKGSNSEYYLAMILSLNDVAPSDVQRVNLLPTEQMKAMAKGEIDAMMVWEPFATMIKEKLGDNAVSWPGQLGHDYSWLLISTRALVTKRSDAIRRLVSALASAEDFIQAHYQEAERIVAAEIGPAHQHSLWKNHKFCLGLDHPLILVMEDQIRWMNRQVRTKQSEFPNLHSFVYFDALFSVRPNKVKILH